MKTIKKSVADKRILAPSSDDPKVELRRLVKEHQALVRGAVAIEHRASDREIRNGPRKGEIAPCLLPQDTRDMYFVLAKNSMDRAKGLERAMLEQLKKFVVYQMFFSKVYGMGTMVSAYLIAEVDIARQTPDGRPLKPSSLIRFCGNGCVDGKAERKTAGVKLPYNQELKSMIWQAMQAMRKNAAKRTVCDRCRKEWSAFKENAKTTGRNPTVAEKEEFDAKTAKCKGCLKTEAPYGYTNKYLELWYQSKFGCRHAGMGPGEADNKSRRKATDLLLIDTYTIWRAISGLEVWPSYYEKRIGPGHRGFHLLGDIGPKQLSVQQALDLIGDFDIYPLKAERSWTIEVPGEDKTKKRGKKRASDQA